MDTKKLFRLLFLVLGYCLTMTSCSDDSKTDWNLAPSLITRSVVTPDFDWENADWMPTPAGYARIPVPWIGAGSLSSFYETDILNDYKSFDGWEMLYNAFSSEASSIVNNPFFVLYNKYRGTMRIYLYITTPFVATSSYIQNGISVISAKETSILNFLGQPVLDAVAKDQKSYVQLQPAPIDGSMPLATNRWYMMEYELAYDQNLSSIPYNEIRFNWFLNYYSVSKIYLDGKMEGKLNAILGQGAVDHSNKMGNILQSDELKSIGTGVLAGIGLNSLERNKISDAKDGQSNNKLGLKNGIFNALYNGVSSALKGSTSGLPGLIIGFVSGIVGGSSNKGINPPVNYQLMTTISLSGTSTNSGAFPSMPISFWLPGTENVINATGYVPLYNKILGVVNFKGKPDIKSHEQYYEYQGFDPEYGDYINEVHRIVFDTSKDYSPYLEFNPEVKAIADIHVTNQEIVLYYNKEVLCRSLKTSYNNEKYTYWEEGVYTNHWNTDWANFNKYAGDVCVRFSIKIQPKNGAPVSHIIKTFKLKENRTSEELESMPNYLKPNYNDYNLEKDYHLILKPKR